MYVEQQQQMFLRITTKTSARWLWDGLGIRSGLALFGSKLSWRLISCLSLSLCLQPLVSLTLT